LKILELYGKANVAKDLRAVRNKMKNYYNKKLPNSTENIKKYLYQKGKKRSREYENLFNILKQAEIIKAKCQKQKKKNIKS
tara:strand:+ start:7545 stop:7787 length:243 start_codon:yes stop_codon:yes gene_type:complete